MGTNPFFVATQGRYASEFPPLAGADRKLGTNPFNPAAYVRSTDARTVRVPAGTGMRTGQI